VLYKNNKNNKKTTIKTSIRPKLRSAKVYIGRKFENTNIFLWTVRAYACECVIIIVTTIIIIMSIYILLLFNTVSFNLFYY